MGSGVSLRSLKLAFAFQNNLLVEVKDDASNQKV